MIRQIDSMHAYRPIVHHQSGGGLSSLGDLRAADRPQCETSTGITLFSSSSATTYISLSLLPLCLSFIVIGQQRQPCHISLYGLAGRYALPLPFGSSMTV